MKLKQTLWVTLCACAVIACEPAREQEDVDKPDWIQLFNGKDLTGWTPKFTGLPPGENYLNTFRVEDSLLTVSYENYDSMGGYFGHLVFGTAYSSYKLRAEYKFNGDQVPGAPEWAYANNGLMLHCQPAETMSVDQYFPLSLEFQLLGQREPGVGRPCGNLCTPGTNVHINGQLRTDHCLEDYEGPTMPIDDWVVAEAVVYGDSIIYHVLNGDTVLAYTDPVIAGALDGLDTTLFQIGTSLDHGRIAIQAESHGIEFRRIELLPLENLNE